MAPCRRCCIVLALILFTICLAAVSCAAPALPPTFSQATTAPITAAAPTVAPAAQPAASKPPGSPTPDQSIPAFPWPPPLPSTSALVPLSLLADASRQVLLSDIDKTLVQALDATGYYEKAYFSIPGGFALVTRLEQIQADGVPLKPPDRWSVKIKALHEFSLAEYIRALFGATPGHYRIIVFLVTDQPLAEKGEPASREAAGKWLSEGANQLPPDVGQQGVTARHTVNAYIYQFEQPGRGKEAVLLLADALPGREHLERAQLWGQLVVR